MATDDFARYLNIRITYTSSFAPDGDKIAFLTNITGVPQVWQVPSGGGWPEQLTFFADRVSFGPPQAEFESLTHSPANGAPCDASPQGSR